MAKFTVRFDGLREARATVALLPEAFKDQARESFQVWRRIALTETARRVPVRFGSLKASLGSNTRDDGLMVAVGFGDRKAQWVEFATEDTPAQPSLYPAFRLASKFVRSDMRNWAKKARDAAITANVNAGVASIGSVGGVSFKTKVSSRTRTKE